MDHEASGAQEWQLPGYGRPAASASRSATTQAQTSAFKSPTSSDSKTLKPSPMPAAKGTMASARGEGRGAARARGRGGSYNTRGGSNAAASCSNALLFKDSPAKAKWRAGLEPTGVVELPTTFGTLKHDFFATARATIADGKFPVSQGRYEVFEDIARKTDTFVKPPPYAQQSIYIWGEPAQVASAKDILQRLAASCNATWSSKKNIEWAKISAHSWAKEADVDLKERHESRLHQLRHAPESPSTFPEQLLFLWPKDGPSLIECLGPHLEALDVIRAEFVCHLFVPKELPDCICALGQNHDVMCQIAHRLRTTWSEIIASSNVKSKILVVEPPTPESMKDRIVVENNNQFAKPFLHGDHQKGTDLEQWVDRADLIKSKNDYRVLGAIERSLRGVAFVRGHLRMRVNIGSFVLDEYRVPKDGKSAYSFEEFREMLMNEQTKGRLVPGLRTNQEEFLAKCFKATNLLEPYESTTHTLKDGEPAFSVNFEFLGTNNDLLRLEAEFARWPGATDYEVTQRRWLRPRINGQAGDKRSPLQIAVVDFERSDWQLEIKSLDFQEASSIDTALSEFSHSITFRGTENMCDISAAPQRKVTFPATAPVSRFVEKTAIRYRLKGTQYTFEIARYDEYRCGDVHASPGQNPPTMVGPISDVPSTSWGASMFDPNWDNLLGQHANLPVGHSARYCPNLNTFFPTREPSILEEKNSGFWDFVSLVKQTAELLSPTQPRRTQNTQLSSIKTSSSSTLPVPLDSKGKAASPTPDSKGLTRMIDADLGTLF